MESQIDNKLDRMAAAYRSAGWNEAYATVYADESESFAERYAKQSEAMAEQAEAIKAQIKAEFLMLKENRDRLQDAFERQAREVLQLKAAPEPTTESLIRALCAHVAKTMPNAKVRVNIEP